jgi:hypothetical protein
MHGVKPWFTGPPTHSQVAVLTKLTHLFIVYHKARFIQELIVDV